MKYIVECPCCNQKLIIRFDSNNIIAALLLEKNIHSPSELSKNYDIELGVIESIDQEE